jgi:hypothetical protein
MEKRMWSGSVSKKSRLSVSDLLALIAATALGLALMRSLPHYNGWYTNVLIIHDDIAVARNSPGWGLNLQDFATTVTERSLQHRPSYWLGHIPYWMGPCLVSGTFASMAMNFQGKRLRLRRLARRPGMAVGPALILALGVAGLQILQASTTNGILLANLSQGWESYWAFVWMTLPRLAGYTVAAWWLALALSGRWSGSVSVGGRLGSVLGWLWIAMAVVGEFGAWSFAMNY